MAVPACRKWLQAQYVCTWFLFSCLCPTCFDDEVYLRPGTQNSCVLLWKGSTTIQLFSFLFLFVCFSPFSTLVSFLYCLRYLSHRCCSQYSPLHMGYESRSLDWWTWWSNGLCSVICHLGSFQSLHPSGNCTRFSLRSVDLSKIAIVCSCQRPCSDVPYVSVALVTVFRLIRLLFSLSTCTTLCRLLVMSTV